FNGELVGYAMNEKMTKSLVMQALFRATASKHPDKGLIAHSDSKNTYTSVEFGKRCREMGVHRSMGSVGDAYDNAMAESFFASLECELIDRRSWKNKTEARLAIFTWIESWYNPTPRHSGLGYLSPNNFERKLNEKNQIAINCNPLSQVETLSTP
ncbi:integrase core domain-containing protein, partial [Nitrosomonas ureae]